MRTFERDDLPRGVMAPDDAADIVSTESVFIHARSSPIGLDRGWKRALDLAVGGPLLLAGLPVLILGALAIALAGGGAVIFWQKRIGQGGREFWFPKLRSMYVGAEGLQDALRDQNDHGESITFKMRQDPRVTRIGKLLRMLSIDELPQLWCVLNGTMSLVGPRPPLPSEALRYTPQQRRRLDVKPGITGLWQVSGRSTIPFDRQIVLDLEYIDRQSLAGDLWILARTVRAVLSCKGAW
jgi:lipopolysaccharide/colanic/teichoic acid biosynthesis glycosyltransferase